MRPTSSTDPDRVGVMAMFLFQIFQSIGMAMGMMPVTGIPLPMVSYGGSSMITSFVAIGLVLGVHRRRFDYDANGIVSCPVA